ncbi:MAG: extracellular solute-binding protein [Erysipelotrichaceae bacterium]|nr:extracellular solute-binding protein [Erysipelotrichaceae bacterium]
MTKIVLLLSVFSLFSSFTSPISKSESIKNRVLKAEESEGSQTLRLLNWEDYIYKNDPDNGYDAPDMVEQFQDWVKANYPEFQDVSVVYSTTDTNETMLTKVETGGSHYDLICPSDYGIQKLIAKDMLVKIKPLMEEEGLVNYAHHASPKLLNYLNNIESTNQETNEVGIVSDYAIGYMWGTLGIIFNPEYDLFSVGPETAIEEMSNWSGLWNSHYHGSISIKDSMRDTYFVGLAETYKNELLDALDKLSNGEIDATAYNAILTDILNRCSPDQISAVKATLEELKKNIFGLEVDSGKQDIVTGKVGANLAWSGDAVYSMNLADETNDSEYGLCYSIPFTGANIWFDGWVMPKDETRSPAQQKLALLFLDFISNPANAAQNMNYIGYTSFIAGDSMLDLVKGWYDARTESLYYVTEDENGESVNNSIFYDDPLDSKNTEVWYGAYHQEENNNPSYDNVKLYWINDDTYYTYYSPSEGEPTSIPEEKKNYFKVTINESEVDATYNNYLLVDPSWEVVDLSYFFNGTLENYQDSIDTVFYSTCYLPFTNEDGSHNIAVGRQFFCQYPDASTITRCVVMKDFGVNNDNIRKMWEDFKSNALEPWVVIVFTVEVGLLVGALIIVTVKNVKNKKMRRLRRQQKNN